MLEPRNHCPGTVIELTKGVFVNTIISQDSHPALRSGFAGYPANPRWNVIKYRAWKLGRQWREQMNQGTMVIRKSDSMLVPISEQSLEQPLQPIPKPKSEFLPMWARQLITSYQT